MTGEDLIRQVVRETVAEVLSESVDSYGEYGDTITIHSVDEALDAYNEGVISEEDLNNYLGLDE
jgi:hypothetical protein